MITYIKGDVTNPFETQPNVIKIIPHVCNDMVVIGSGVALGLARKWPKVKQQNKSTTLGECEFIIVEIDKVVVNMISQHQTIRENPKPIRYTALVKCMIAVRDYVKTLQKYGDKVEIHAPKFGSLRSGGTWEFIEELINEIWQDTPVYIYEYKE